MHHGAGLHGGYGLLIGFAVVGGGILVALIVLVLSHKSPRAKARGPAAGEPEDEPPLDGRVLDFLNERDGPAMQGETCTRFGATPRTIDGVLARLEDDGLVERYWDPDQGDYAVRVL